MLTHSFDAPSPPARAVVIGAGGFIGRAAADALERRKVATVRVTHADVDLLDDDAASRLRDLLRPGDRVVVVSARAPVKNNAMLIDNLRMMSAVCDAITTSALDQIVYVSSDAVYADSAEPLTERSCAQPASLHGVMHLAREVMLANAFAGPLCFVRPTLVYGESDPHNGYGPNRFRRLANDGADIVLFGEGEERRDHVYVDDVGELIARCVMHRSRGVLNAATGVVASFREIAERTNMIAGGRAAVRTQPRVGAMPHGGFRAFDPAMTFQSFPDFRYTSLSDGLAKSQRGEFHG